MRVDVGPGEFFWRKGNTVFPLLSWNTGGQIIVPSSTSSDDAARRVRAELRLSDRRWAWARLRSRVEAKDWGGVEAMAASDAAALSATKGGGKKARSSSSSSSAAAALPLPIVVDIVRMCRRGGAPEAAVLRLFARLPDDAAKVEALASAGLRRDAARVAARLGALGGSSGGGGGNGGGGSSSTGGGSSGQNADDLFGRLQQGVLSFGRGLVGGGR